MEATEKDLDNDDLVMVLLMLIKYTYATWQDHHYLNLFGSFP